ncbi:dihydrolipoyl dehydrogenase [Buchnera aphidicola]|uniref:dihydrolipoyl dehydrogenase n=1 Tax=Buchnera aphidicola TaxID=9 RepID=UPI00223784D8|nr:dihydrolipoyl dehydrogenase [Buchnera aphidicola]MCW5197765.1 dihydrolipoyl dehydrogenase [Buchnera aphidicola (Chaitophorus viminalis)]
MNKEINTNLVVIGGGPAGYSAAFRASDLGIKTILIEKNKVLGGVCLNEGCIPSKTLLHFAKFLQEYKEFMSLNIIFNTPKFDLKKLNIWKKNIIKNMNFGLDILARQRNVKIITGEVSFINENRIIVNNGLNTNCFINFKNIIIASGSRSIKLPNIKSSDKRVWYSTEALKIPFIPDRMLIVGGGIIGLEMATVYSSLGSIVDVIENSNSILPSVDVDITNFFIKTVQDRFNIMLKSSIQNINFLKDSILVTIKTENTIKKINYDIILVSIGRFPNTDSLKLNNTEVQLNEHKYIITDQQCRTNVSNIFAIGDVSGHPMLAHKGIYEGHIAAEVISGKNHFFDTKIIPNVCYTDPEIAWVGITEKEAENKNIQYSVSVFPWNISGRAHASNSSMGKTKLIFNKNTRQIIGGSIIGRNAGELLGEITLAIEMGCDVSDISLTMHAHPTLYESINSASKIFEGTVTDLLNIT